MIDKAFCSTGLLVAALLCCFLTIGCKSTKPKTGPGASSLASIEIQGYTGLEIAHAVSETFKAAGFEAIPQPQNDELRMQFEKRAGTAASILYSDWSLKEIWTRVRIKFIKTDERSFVVTCNAFRVNERGSAHFEEESRLTGISRGPYQELLDHAKAKLAAPEQ